MRAMQPVAPLVPVSVFVFVVAIGLIGSGCEASADGMSASTVGPHTPDIGLLGDIGLLPIDAAGSEDLGLIPLGLEAGPAASVDPSADERPPSKSSDALVPIGVAERAGVVVRGQMAAWIERAAGGDTPPQLVVMPLDSDEGPRPLRIPYLSQPSQLALGDGWLFYVDDRYGDADVFAFELATGRDFPVATLPGAQSAPTASGATVAWQDCRACIGGGRSEIYRREAPDGAELRLTDDDVDDLGPRFGDLGAGVEALVWHRSDGGVRLRSAALDTAYDLEPVLGVALTDGILAYRPSPAVINPDSMIPSDVFSVTAATGQDVRALSVHSEQWGARLSAPQAAGGRVAWLEGLPGSTDPAAQRLLVVGVPLAEVQLDRAVDGGSDASLSDGYVAFIAPREDNEGLPDVWILPL